eukprot:GHVQ01012737.1.p2 GENE.GHVQ01012737.1~~GHVQ01012737.1.p2  ORF type:complete len:361 (+),score=40.25 GHVQ01012737.1:126-1208(+)
MSIEGVQPTFNALAFEEEYLDKQHHLSDNCILFVVVPYRSRLEHLQTWLTEIYAYFNAIFAATVNFQWHILIVHQTDSKPFNRGLLFNSAVVHILSKDYVKLSEEHHRKVYLCFHDVDIVPQGRHFDFNYRGSKACHYYCPDAGTVNHLYGHMWGIGGVFTIQLQDYIRIRGFCNSFWGWGWEDNDFQRRCERGTKETCGSDECSTHNKLTVRRHEFSERLSAASSFRELDKSELHLHTVLALKTHLSCAIRNKQQYEQDIEGETSDLRWMLQDKFQGANIHMVATQNTPVWPTLREIVSNPQVADSQKTDDNSSKLTEELLEWIDVSASDSYASMLGYEESGCQVEDTTGTSQLFLDQE